MQTWNESNIKQRTDNNAYKPLKKSKPTLFEKNVISRLQSIEDLLKSESESNKESKDREEENLKSLSKIKDSINASIKVSKTETINKIEEIGLNCKKILYSINRENNKIGRLICSRERLLCYSSCAVK